MTKRERVAEKICERLDGREAEAVLEVWRKAGNAQLRERDWAVLPGWVRREVPPCRRPDHDPGAGRKQAVITLSEVQQVVTACRTAFEKPPVAERNRLLVKTMFGCALRQSEGRKLQLRQLDFGRQTLHLPEGKTKNRKAATVPLPPEVARELEDWTRPMASDPASHLFQPWGRRQPGGGKIGIGAWRGVLDALRSELVENFGWTRARSKAFGGHSFRKAMLNELSKREGIEAARTLARHSSIEMLLHYIEATPEEVARGTSEIAGQVFRGSERQLELSRARDGTG